MRKSPEQRFWQWFVKNAERLLTFEADCENIFDELLAQLHKVHEYLAFEFGPLENGKREFVVSADGIREAFPAVQSLVDAAPSLDNWIITPFRQPRDMDIEVQFGDYKLGSDDVWFSTEMDGDRIGITLYIRNLLQENEQVAAQASFILLDNALGEFDVETKVGFIEYQPLPSDPDGEGLLPFRSIREAIADIAY